MNSRPTSDEREERVKQIRERQIVRLERPMSAFEGALRDDIYFLLSLLDNQAEAFDRGYLGGSLQGHADGYELGYHDAATRMREACVEKVEEIHEGRLKDRRAAFSGMFKVLCPACAAVVGETVIMSDEHKELEPMLSPYWEFDADGHPPKPALRECPLCPNGGQPYSTRTVNGTNMIYVGCSQCGLQLKAALLMVTPVKEQPSKDIVTIWNTRTVSVAPVSLVKDGGGLAPERLTKRVCKDGFIDCGYHSKSKSREVEYVRADLASRASVAAPQGDRLLSLKELTEATLLSLEKIDTAKLAALGRDRDAESVGNARRLLDRILFELRGLK